MDTTAFTPGRTPKTPRIAKPKAVAPQHSADPEPADGPRPKGAWRRDAPPRTPPEPRGWWRLATSFTAFADYLLAWHVLVAAQEAAPELAGALFALAPLYAEALLDAPQPTSAATAAPCACDWPDLCVSSVPAWRRLHDALLDWANQWGLIDPAHRTAWAVAAALGALSATVEWDAMAPGGAGIGRPSGRIADHMPFSNRGAYPEADAALAASPLRLSLPLDLRDAPRHKVEAQARAAFAAALAAHLDRQEAALRDLGYQPPTQARASPTAHLRPVWFAENVVARKSISDIARRHRTPRKTVAEALEQVGAVVGLPVRAGKRGRPSSRHAT